MVVNSTGHRSCYKKRVLAAFIRTLWEAVLNWCDRGGAMGVEVGEGRQKMEFWFRCESRRRSRLVTGGLLALLGRWMRELGEGIMWQIFSLRKEEWRD